MSFKIYADIEHAVYKATADISKYSEETGQKIRAAVQTGCENIRDRAIRAAPKGESGKLVAGLTAKMAPRGAYGEIKSTSSHSHMVEFGTGMRIAMNKPQNHKKAMVINGDYVRGAIVTGKMEKRPFMRPAVEAEKPKIEEEIKKILE